MNISENNVFQANKNMESKKSLIDFANYKTDYCYKPKGISSNNTVTDGFLYKNNQPGKIKVIFQIHWNKSIANLLFQKFDSTDFNEIPELSSDKVLFEFVNNKLEFTFSGNHYILE